MHLTESEKANPQDYFLQNGVDEQGNPIYDLSNLEVTDYAPAKAMRKKVFDGNADIVVSADTVHIYWKGNLVAQAQLEGQIETSPGVWQGQLFSFANANVKKINWRTEIEDWSSETTYFPGDHVTHNGVNYYCLISSKNTESPSLSPSASESASQSASLSPSEFLSSSVSESPSESPSPSATSEAIEPGVDPEWRFYWEQLDPITPYFRAFEVKDIPILGITDAVFGLDVHWAFKDTKLSFYLDVPGFNTRIRWQCRVKDSAVAVGDQKGLRFSVEDYSGDVNHESQVDPEPGWTQHWWTFEPNGKQIDVADARTPLERYQQGAGLVVDPYLSVDEQATYFDIYQDGFTSRVWRNGSEAYIGKVYDKDAVGTTDLFSFGSKVVVGGTTYAISEDTGISVVCTENTRNRVILRAQGDFETSAQASLSNEAGSILWMTFYPDRIVMRVKFNATASITLSDSAVNGLIFMDSVVANLTNEDSKYESSGSEADAGGDGSQASADYIATLADEINCQGIAIETTLGGGTGTYVQYIDDPGVALRFGWNNGTITAASYLTVAWILDSAERQGSAKLYDSTDRLAMGDQFKDVILDQSPSKGDDVTDMVLPARISSGTLHSDGAHHYEPNSEPAVKYTLDRTRIRPATVIHDWPFQYGPFEVITDTDDFGSSTQQNILTGGDGAKSYGWNLLNSGAASAIDVNITNSGELTVSHNATNTDFNAAIFTGPFIYKEINGDFDVRIKVSSLTNANENYDGVDLIAYDPTASAGYDHVRVLIQYHATPAAMVMNYWSNVANSVRTDFLYYNNGHKYLRIKRTGNFFTVFTSIDGIVWLRRVKYDRSDFASTIQVGIGVHTYNTSGDLVARVEYYENAVRPNSILLNHLKMDDNAANNTLLAEVGPNGTWHAVSDGSARNTSNDSVATDNFRGRALDTQDGTAYGLLAFGETTVHPILFLKQGSIILKVTPQFVYTTSDETILTFSYNSNNIINIWYYGTGDQLIFKITWTGIVSSLSSPAFSSNYSLQRPMVFMFSWDADKDLIIACIDGKVINFAINTTAPQLLPPVEFTIGCYALARTTPADIIFDEIKTFSECVLPFGAYFIGNGEGFLADIDNPHADLTFFWDCQASGAGAAKGGANLANSQTVTLFGSAALTSGASLVGNYGLDVTANGGTHGASFVKGVDGVLTGVVDGRKGSLGIWVNLQTGSAAIKYFACFYDGSNNNFSLTFDSSDQLYFMYKANGTQYTLTGTDYTSKTNVWTFVRINWADSNNGGYIEMFENGLLTDSDTVAQPYINYPSAGTITMYIGASGIGGENSADIFVGKMYIAQPRTPEIWTAFGKPLHIPLISKG